MKPTPCLLVEDLIMVQECLKIHIEQHPYIAKVDAARTGAEALDLAQRSHYGLACLDIDLPDMDGFDLSARLLRIRPGMMQLAVSSHCSPDTILRFRKSCSINGLIDKDFSGANDLHEAISKVLDGRMYLSKPATEVLHKSGDQIRAVYHQMSQREQQVTKLVALGYSDTEIADNLKITMSTVRNHRSNILRKLQLSTARDMMIFAMQFGMVRPSQFSPSNRA